MSTPTSGYIDNEAQAACPPNPELDTGAEFHSCEHCKDFTLDFGLTDEELDEMLQNRMKGSSTAMELNTNLIEKLEETRKDHGEVAIFSDTGNQVIKESVQVVYYTHPWIRSVQDNPLSGDIHNGPTVVDPWSESTKAQVTQWMKDCSDTCEMCQNEEDFSPTYLIKLSPCMSKCLSGCPSDCCGFTLRLMKDIQGPVSYAALSYCWGGDQHFKTTKSNIHSLLCNIPYTDLPATLKDAAKVAFDLNFQFLWIDALCLIQDPGEDEIQTMIAEIPNIYRYAALTIAAKSSNSVNEGFLHSRHAEDISILEHLEKFGLYNFRIAIKNLCGKSGFATIQTYNVNNKHFPILLTRGWTLQEQVLSKRFLSFSKATTQWQFYGGSSDKGCFADGGDISSWGRQTDLISSKWKILQFSKSPKTAWKRRQLWQVLVAGYMQRELSIRKDRPIAISALASDLGDAKDYVAGLWLSDLCHGLSWIPNSPQKEAVVGYYAPSWSWWSATTTLVWLKIEEDDMYQEPMFRLVEYHSRLAHERAPFGYLVEVSLRVEACCGRVLVTDHRKGRVFSYVGLKFGTSSYICLRGAFGNKDGVICDWRDGFAKGQVLYLLVLFISKKDMTRISGLVLIDVEDNGSEQNRKCRRVGTFDIRGQKQDDRTRFVEWVGERPVETLTLV